MAVGFDTDTDYDAMLSFLPVKQPTAAVRPPLAGGQASAAAPAAEIDYDKLLGNVGWEAMDKADHAAWEERTRQQQIAQQTIEDRETEGQRLARKIRGARADSYGRRGIPDPLQSPGQDPSQMQTADPSPPKLPETPEPEPIPRPLAWLLERAAKEGAAAYEKHKAIPFQYADSIPGMRKPFSGTADTDGAKKGWADQFGLKWTPEVEKMYRRYVDASHYAGQLLDADPSHAELTDFGKKVPQDERRLVAEMMGVVKATKQPAGVRFAQNAFAGWGDWAEAVDRMVGQGESDSDRKYGQMLLQAQQSANPIVRPDDSWFAGNAIKAAHGIVPLSQSVAFGAVGGAGGSLVAGGLAGAAPFVPETMFSTYDRLEGVDERVRWSAAIGSAAAQSLLFGLIPAAGLGKLGGAAADEISNVVGRVAVKYGIGAGEALGLNAAAGASSEVIEGVAQVLDKKDPEWSKRWREYWQSQKEGAVPLLFSLAPLQAIHAFTDNPSRRTAREAGIEAPSEPERARLQEEFKKRTEKIRNMPLPGEEPAGPPATKAGLPGIDQGQPASRQAPQDHAQFRQGDMVEVQGQPGIIRQIIQPTQPGEGIGFRVETDRGIELLRPDQFWNRSQAARIGQTTYRTEGESSEQAHTQDTEGRLQGPQDGQGAGGRAEGSELPADGRETQTGRDGTVGPRPQDAPQAAQAQSLETIAGPRPDNEAPGPRPLRPTAATPSEPAAAGPRPVRPEDTGQPESSPSSPAQAAGPRANPHDVAAGLVRAVPGLRGKVQVDGNQVIVDAPGGRLVIEHQPDEFFEEQAQKHPEKFKQSAAAQGLDPGEAAGYTLWDGETVHVREGAAPEEVAHELVHVLEDRGFISPDEIKLLGGREGAASFVQRWIAGGRLATGVWAKAKNVLQKVWDMAVAVTGRGGEGLQKRQLARDIVKRMGGAAKPLRPGDRVAGDTKPAFSVRSSQEDEERKPSLIEGALARAAEAIEKVSPEKQAIFRDLVDRAKAGDRAAVDEVNQRFGSRFPPVPQTHDSIEKLIDDTLASKDRSRRSQQMGTVYRTVDKEEAQRTRDATGIDVEGFRHFADEDAIRKILERHGPSARLKQNDLPVTREDIERLREIMAAPDAVRLTEKGSGRNKLPAIEYRKQVNGHLYVVEEVRDSRGVLALQAMYKREGPQKKVASVSPPPASTPVSGRSIGPGLDVGESNATGSIGQGDQKVNQPDPDFSVRPRAVKNLLGMAEAKTRVSVEKGRIENEAVIHAQRETNEVRNALGEALGRPKAKPTKLDGQALSFVVEALADPTTLVLMQRQIQQSPASLRPWGKEAIKAIEHAQTHLAELAPIAQLYETKTDAQLQREAANGFEIESRKGYVFHMQEQPTADVPFAEHGSGTSTAFKHERTFNTFADSIAAGKKPISINALEALESRLRRGGAMIGNATFADVGRGILDRNSGRALIRDLVTSPRGDQTPPDGYDMMRVGNKNVAVLKGYSSLYRALTGSRSCAIRRSAARP